MVDGRVNRAISVVRSQIRTTIQNIYYCSLPLLRGNLDVSSSGTWYFANSEFPRFPTVNLSSATTFYHASLKPLAPGNRLRTITSDPYTTIRFLFELVHHWTEIIDKQWIYYLFRLFLLYFDTPKTEKVLQILGAHSGTSFISARGRGTDWKIQRTTELVITWGN